MARTARLDRDGLARLIERLEPGGRLIGTRRLRGGVGARMDILAIERRDGTRRKVSLRRFLRSNRSSRPAHVAHEFRILQLLEEAGVPAPRPLLLDADGELLGAPTIVLTYLPGRPVYHPRDRASWAGQLAAALRAVHVATPDRFDLSWLGRQLRDGIGNELETRRPFAEQHGPLAREVHAALVDGLDRVAWLPPALAHDDFWPGNTVWYRGRLTGVIDWTHAEVGDPRTDVAQCRLDLALILDARAADEFRDAYEALGGGPLPDAWYFDLLRGLRALLSYEFWLPGYHDAGLTYLTPRRMRSRIDRFLRGALADRGAGRRRLQ